MKDLTEEQKELISQKQNEYHEFSLKNNLLENELAVLKIERDKKQEEYEEAKSQLDSANKIYSINRCNFDNSKVEYVNKAEIKYIFLIILKVFGILNAVSLGATLAGVIDILSFKDVLNYFLCSPLLGGTLSVIVSSFFSDKTKRKFLKKFYNLEDSKKLLDDIEEKRKVFSEKNIVFEEKKKALKECKYHIEQLEYRIRSNKCEMDNIKSSIFDVIYSVDAKISLFNEMPKAGIDSSKNTKNLSSSSSIKKSLDSMKSVIEKEYKKLDVLAQKKYFLIILLTRDVKVLKNMSWVLIH